MSPATLPQTAARGGRKPPESLLRYSAWDCLFIVLALAHGVLLVAFPLVFVIALGVWWNSNTIAHNFIHKPFFRRVSLNRLFALYQSVLLGIPQTLWKERHLAHHAGVRWRLRLSFALVVETLAVLLLWGSLLALSPAFFLQSYLPGYAAGLFLCWLHGYFEHQRGTISHYGKLYNTLFFNDGYHVEHHARPGTHWTELPKANLTPHPLSGPERGQRGEVGVSRWASRWPAVLRWLDLFSLEALERLVLRSPALQRFVLRKHEQAFRKVLAGLPSLRRVAIVGGGLFPRTALILERLLPDAQLTIIDASAENLAVARQALHDRFDCRNEWFEPARHDDFDLIVIPLAYVGHRRQLYREPPAPFLLIHDWVWHWRPGAVVSWLLLKRLNLVAAADRERCPPSRPDLFLCTARESTLD